MNAKGRRRVALTALLVALCVLPSTPAFGQSKQQLEKELAEQEQKLQAVNKEADLEKWCVKPETLTNVSPDPGPGKKAAKNKKSKKIRRKKNKGR